MNKFKKISYNCHQATFLIEKKQIRRLTIRERLELNWHLAGCSVCRIFEKQSILINRLVHGLFQASQQEERPLNEDFKKGLQDRIDEELKK